MDQTPVTGRNVSGSPELEFRELTPDETALVGGGFSWQAFAFVGGLALATGNPLVAIGAGVIAGFVAN
jgi:hypothetical protein